VRDLDREEIDANKEAAEACLVTTQAHMYEFLPVGMTYLEKEKLAAAAAGKTSA
jgi:hypothetical protein